MKVNKKNPFFFKKGEKLENLRNFKGLSLSRKHGEESPFIN